MFPTWNWLFMRTSEDDAGAGDLPNRKSQGRAWYYEKRSYYNWIGSEKGNDLNTPC
jgi:hypothetical protein